MSIERFCHGYSATLGLQKRDMLATSSCNSRLGCSGEPDAEHGLCRIIRFTANQAAENLENKFLGSEHPFPGDVMINMAFEMEFSLQLVRHVLKCPRQCSGVGWSEDVRLAQGQSWSREPCDDLRTTISASQTHQLSLSKCGRAMERHKSRSCMT